MARGTIEQITPQHLWSPCYGKESSHANAMMETINWFTRTAFRVVPALIDSDQALSNAQDVLRPKATECGFTPVWSRMRLQHPTIPSFKCPTQASALLWRRNQLSISPQSSASLRTSNRLLGADTSTSTRAIKRPYLRSTAHTLTMLPTLSDEALRAQIAAIVHVDTYLQVRVYLHEILRLSIQLSIFLVHRT